MDSSSKIAKFRRRKDINIGMIVFLIIFVYVCISVYLFFSKNHLSIYEVKEGSTSSDNVFNGLIIREEEVFINDTPGYINYYHKDGERITKNSTVYSIDENKSSSTVTSDETIDLSSDDIVEIKKEITNFQKSYQDADYSKTYDFKYDLENTLLEITNDSMLSKLQNDLGNSEANNTFHIVKSKSSGIITYNIDNMEDITIDTVTSDNFNLDKYKETQLRTLNLVKVKSPVYKLVEDDSWNIVLLLDKTQYKKLKEKDSVKITFTDNGLSTIVPISVFKKGSDLFARLDLDKYMIQYVNNRYVNIELAINSAKGLKIPISSIVKKDFYKIPLEYFTIGGDSGSNGLIKETYNENGDVKYTFVPADIYYSDEKYGFIDARLFTKDTWIQADDTGERFEINTDTTTSLEGVFNVNKGYAVFRRIEILYENEEYCIVDKETQYGLSVYDHIALIGKTAVEQALIY